MWEFFMAHPGWVIIPGFFLLWGIVELIVAWTPTGKDDAAWKIVRKWILVFLSFIPRYKKGGGKPNE